MKEWRTDWTTGADLDPRLMFDFQVGTVGAVALDVVSDRPVIAACIESDSTRNKLWVRDPLSGWTIGFPGEEVARCLSFSNLDGEPVLVSGHEDGCLRLWSMAAGVLRNTIITGDQPVRDLYLADSEAVTRDGRGNIRRWSLPTGELLGVLAQSRGLALCGGRLSDGRHVLMICGDGLTLWDIDFWAPQRLPVPSEFRNARSVALSTLNGRDCVTLVNEYHLIATFDLENLTQVGAPLIGHVNRSRELRQMWSYPEAHAKPAVIGGTIAVPAPWRVHLWDLSRGEEQTSLAGPVARSCLAAVHQGRDLLLAGSYYDGSVALYDLGRSATREPGHDQRITGIALTASKDVVVSVDEGGTIVARRASDGHLMAAPLATGVEMTHAISAWKDHEDIIAATGGGTIHVSDKALHRWNVTRGGIYGQTIEAHRRFVWWIERTFVEDQEVLVTVGPPLIQPPGYPSVIRVWRVSDGILLGEASTETRSMITGFATGFIDGRPVAALSTYAQSIKLLALDELSAPPRDLPEAANYIILDIIDSYVIAVASTPDHTLSGEVNVWDGAGDRFGPGIQGSVGVRAVAVREWPAIYIAWEDRTVSLVDLATGHNLCEALRLPRSPTALTAIGDGDLIIGFGSDLARVAPLSMSR